MMNKINLSRADLNLLVLFEAVLEERNVGKAATRLNLTASAVSHGLGRLRRLLNDPLFMKTPKGVVPTARAVELTLPIAEILAGVRSVISTAEPFDQATSKRRFTIGAPDGVSAVLLPPLLDELHRSAPGLDISIRQLLPMPGEMSPQRAWLSALIDLESRAMDIAILPSDDVPSRFQAHLLYEEDFVVTMRSGHPLAEAPSLDQYCNMQHLVVSATGEAYGFVDRILAEKALTRRIVLTVPNFMFALAMLAETDLVSALPRRFVSAHGNRFGVVGFEPPLRLGRFRLQAIVPKAAIADAGLSWLLSALVAVGQQIENNKADAFLHRL
jgi:DNA-binding transcriptional LysR family regulator